MSEVRKTIHVEMQSDVGPRVIVAGEWGREEIERELPLGWTIGDNWNGAVALADGSRWYRIAQA